jgi:hypothetical protein
MKEKISNKKKAKLAVFQCSCTERGRPCASEFTRVNAYAPMFKTLERKSPGGVTLEVIIAGAICPFHAHMLNYIRTDIVRMDDVLSVYFARRRRFLEREAEIEHQTQERRRKRQRWVSATTSELSVKLQEALKK